MLTNEELDIIQHATGRNYTPRRVRNWCLPKGGQSPRAKASPVPRMLRVLGC